MENRAYAIAVGIFTLMLGIGVVFAYWWISGSQQVRTSYAIVSTLPVTGLSPEAKVKFRGVDVGKVTEISLDPSSQNTIRIGIEVAQGLRVSKATYAELHLQGLTGLAFIDLNDEGNSAPVLSASDMIPLRATFTDQLLAKGPELVAQLEVLLKNSSQLTASANRLLTNLDTQKFNHTVANIEKASEQAIPALNSATIAFNNVSKMASEKNQAQLARTLENIQQTSDAAMPLISELTQTAKNFRGTSDQIALEANQLTNILDKETLPQLHALTQNMNQSVSHFDQFISILEENPQSIIFGKPAQLPGPGEAGFTIKP